MLPPPAALAQEAPPEPLAALPWACPRVLPEEAPADPPAWSELPVSTDTRRVAFDYGRRFQEIYATTMGGPRASSVFGPTVAQADLHWRLLDATGRGVELDADSPTHWRDLALSGAFLAAEDLFEETVERAPVLHGAWVLADSVASPSFDFIQDVDSGAVRVEHRSGGPARRAIERQEQRLGERTPRPERDIGLGLDWELRGEDEPEQAPLLRYIAWVETTRIGLSAMRAEVAPLSLAWELSGRQFLAPGLALIGTARSEERDPYPGLLSGGLMYTFPGGVWNIRLERVVGWDGSDAHWQLTLRGERHTPVPAPLEPPLGDRGRGGPTLPWVLDQTPPTLEAWGRTPEERATSTSAAPR